ncbi:MAG: alanine--tRNA ligase, partial [Deltaproteobacteria bacterium]|nr:alanine--tRNA ligase [Deltaproteobacteria bacterium]
FKLYDTFGFPVDIVRDMAREKGFSIDEAGFNLAMDEQRCQSRQAGVCALPETAPGLKQLAAKAGKTEFLGYETRQSDAKITAIIAGDGAAAARGGSGECVLIACAATPFYAESGGQSGDQGEISGPRGRGRVLDTIKTADGVFLHKVSVEDGEMAVGDTAQLRVTTGRRRDIAANHSATHLLQAVLRRTLGGHIKQAGSLVEAERLRFDFTHFSALSLDELVEIEGLVNEAVRRNIPMATKIMDREAAQKSGAMALFGEKYGDKVRVVGFGDFSTELCGGTHVGATGEIGLFKIISETGISAGVRRITAITGRAAFADYQKARAELTGLADRLKCGPTELTVKINALLLHQKELEKEVAALSSKLSLSGLDDMLAESRDVQGVKVVAAQITLDSPKTLREIGDRMRDKIGSGVIVLGGELNGKVALLTVVTKDLTSKCQAGRIVKEVAALVGGGGGGRPDMAQAGGTMVDKLPEALARVYDIVAGQMT